MLKKNFGRKKNSVNKLLNVLIIAALFAALVLSGGCGGGGGSTDVPKLAAESAVTEAPEEKQEAQKEIRVAVIKEEGTPDEEAFKEAGLTDAADAGQEQPEQKSGQPAAAVPRRMLRSVVLGAASADDVSSIEEVIIPGNVSLVGMNAFDSRWSSLKRVIINDTKVKLSYRTFNNCPNLEEVCIGEGTSSNYFDFKNYISAHYWDSYSYPDQAFYNCPRLRVIRFGHVAPPANTAFISSCGGSVGGTAIEAPYAKYGEYAGRFGSRYTVRGMTWSESFPDTMLVNQISIPGTHDSCTYGVDSAFVEEAETQVYTLSEQLDKGIRCFDLRPHHANSDVNDIEVYHGPIACNISFHSAFRTLRDHVAAHPRDFVIALVNHEMPSAGDVALEYCDLVGKVEAGNNGIQDALLELGGYLAEFKPGMTVKDMRGKVLFILRDSVNGRDPVGAYTRSWGSHTYSAALESKYGRTDLLVQDKNSTDDEACADKLSAVQQTLNEFAGRVRGNHSYNGWCVNHTSGYYTKVYITLLVTGVWVDGINYPYNAEKVNKATADHIGGLNGPAGIIQMDFAGKPDRSHWAKTYQTRGDVLLNAVINHNF